MVAWIPQKDGTYKVYLLGKEEIEGDVEVLSKTTEDGLRVLHVRLKPEGTVTAKVRIDNPILGKRYTLYRHKVDSEGRLLYPAKIVES